MRLRMYKREFTFILNDQKLSKRNKTLHHGNYTSIFDTKTIILEEIMNIYKYANKLFCILLLQFKEQFMMFHLIPLRLF
jgi:hypothetical protein